MDLYTEIFINGNSSKIYKDIDCKSQDSNKRFIHSFNYIIGLIIYTGRPKK